MESLPSVLQGYNAPVDAPVTTRYRRLVVHDRYVLISFLLWSFLAFLYVSVDNARQKVSTESRVIL